ncbi:MAG: hypothetical protein WCO06_02795 [Candidatus Roizmanbacteria bacterium]
MSKNTFKNRQRRNVSSSKNSTGYLDSSVFQGRQVERISYSMEMVYKMLGKNRQKIINMTLVILLIVGLAILVNDIRIKNAYKLDGVDAQDFSKDIDSDKKMKELPLKGTSIKIPCEEAKKIDSNIPCDKQSDGILKK